MKRLLTAILVFTVILIFAAPAMSFNGDEGDRLMTSSDLAAFSSGADINITATTPSGDILTQQAAIDFLLLLAGLKESSLGIYPADWNSMAKSIGLLDGIDYVPEAPCTAEVFYAMYTNTTPIIEALEGGITSPLFVDGMAQPIFAYDEIVRFCVYVETNYDTDADGKLDLVKTLVQLPAPALQGMKVATVFEARPYIAGTNGQSIPNGYEGTTGYDLQKLYAKPAARIPAGESTTAEVAAAAKPSDWYYQYNGSWVYEDLTWYDYYTVRGFAVVESGGIGTMGSEGFSVCGADVEIDAFKCIIEWLSGDRVAYTDKTGNVEIKADWSNGNVGMTGRSYAGTTQFGLATTGVEGLKTVVPVAGIASWYEYTNSQGVYGTLEYTQGLAWHCNSRYREADYDSTIKTNYGEYLYQLRLDQRNSTGDYNNHWAVRDYTTNWANIKCPALIVHGTNDDNVRTKQSDLMYQAYAKSGQTVKMLLHQGTHMTPTYPAGSYEMYIDDMLYDEILNKWFSHYLYGVDNGIENMPAVTAQSNIDGSWNYYDSWVAAKALHMGHADTAAANAPVTTINSAYSTHSPAIGTNNFRNYFTAASTPHSALYTIDITEDTTIKGAVKVHVKAASNDYYHSAALPFSAQSLETTESSDWSDFIKDGVVDWDAVMKDGSIDNDTMMMLGRDFAPPSEVLNSSVIKPLAATTTTSISRGNNLVMSAMLVDIADSSFMVYEGPSSSSARVTTLEKGGAWMGGGVTNFDLVEFAQIAATRNTITNDYYKVIAYGMMDLYNPEAGYDSAGADRSKRVDLIPGEYYDYNLYLQPNLYTIEEGHTLALVIFAFYPGKGPGQPTAAQGQYSITIDNDATYVSIPVDELTMPYTVQFYNADGETVVGTVEVADGDTIDPEDIPVPELADGLEFLGWAKMGTNQAFNLDSPINMNYKLIPLVGYKVEFFAFDNTTVLATQYISQGGLIDLEQVPTEDPADTRVIAGWCYETEIDEETVLVPFDLASTIEQSYRLFPAAAVVFHQVEFLDADGETVLATVEVADGGLIDEAKYPTVDIDEGYELKGWLIQESGDIFDPETLVTQDYRLIPWIEKVVVSNLRLTTDAKDVTIGDEFTLRTFFVEPVDSNTAMLDFAFDTTKFEYVSFTAAEDVDFLYKEDTATGVRITLMVQDYNTTVYGDLKLKAKKDAALKDEENEITVTAQYVVRYADAPKEIKVEIASTVFDTIVGPDPLWDGETFDLLYLSNMIDAFGMNETQPKWFLYEIFDLVADGQIDINDVSLFASKIGK